MELLPCEQVKPVEAAIASAGFRIFLPERYIKIYKAKNDFMVSLANSLPSVGMASFQALWYNNLYKVIIQILCARGRDGGGLCHKTSDH